jgi:alginate O-acetyltransferase complex protein AlgI
MLFTEPAFFAFFAGYFVLHLVLPSHFRLYLIIIGSAIFYSWWRLAYVGLPFSLGVMAWGGTAWLEAAGDKKATRRFRLAAVVAVMLLPLLIFKYSYFLANDVLGEIVNVRALINVDELRWPLPLGISFVTFTLLAYIVDTYRGQYRSERSLATLLAYVLFFPHLIAGPILRPHELMPQLKQAGRALDARFTLGIAIFTLGMVKKLVFADQLAVAVDRIYSTPSDLSGWDYLLGIYGFSAQIYCDFSGYTDMAIGLAYLLRIRLPTNFRTPYISSSIIEFWRRWHITLSYWLRDYLYIPLGGNRRGQSGRARNIMITMLLGGLWHGANWTFLLWGLLHGAALCFVHLEHWLLKRHKARIPGWLGILLTFNFVTFAWIYFRAPNISVAHHVMVALVKSRWYDWSQFVQQHVFEICLLFAFALLHRFDRHAYLRIGVRRVSPSILWPAIIMSWLIAIAVSQGSSAKFIYFEF